MPTPFTWIDTPDDLNDAVERMRQADAIALDTEFVWEKTYYAQLGLVQVGFVDGTCYLIDAVALGDLSSLGTILADAGIIKILHDAPQDLMILRRATGALTRTVFDTRRAAGFAGFASTISLGNLLADLLDVHLAKAHTRADWLARPLAAGVLEYAADDVHYLPTVAARLRERAHANGVEAWLNEELAGLDAPDITAEPDPGEAGQRLRTRQPLPPRAQAVLNELAAWRENRARLADLPRRWLMKDNVL
ncbi:MAG: ribonuclease D, partial [Kiritimatiellae bacterium]|nr:ribonuclease D [Kiritimatiellia bacterium]